MFALLCIVIVGLPSDGRSDTVTWSMGREYDQWGYAPVRSAFSQFNMNSKLECFARCARLTSACNIAVFTRSPTVSACALYGEALTSANLIPAANTIVVHFGRNLSSPGK